MTLEEIAGYLKVSEKTILRMVQAGDLPAFKVSNQWRFLRSAIDEWLTAQMHRTSSESLADVAKNMQPLLSLPDLVPPNRILMDLTPGKKEPVLRQLIGPLVNEGVVVRPQQYMATLFEREQLVSTAIGDGIAVPHARAAEKSGLRNNCVVIGICPQGTDFGALDNMPTRLFFLIGSISTEAHLRLMARTMLLLRIPNIQTDLLTAPGRDEVRSILLRAEKDISLK